MTAQLILVFLMPSSGSRLGYETINFVVSNFHWCTKVNRINQCEIKMNIFTGEKFPIYSKETLLTGIHFEFWSQECPHYRDSTVCSHSDIRAGVEGLCHLFQKCQYIHM